MYGEVWRTQKYNTRKRKKNGKQRKRIMEMKGRNKRKENERLKANTKKG
jgi:hypothetical protein